MSPSPRLTPTPGHGPAPDGLADGLADGPSGSATGSSSAPGSASASGAGSSSSFAASLAVHGLALATLVMTVNLPWPGSSKEPERVIACALEPARSPASARDDREPPLEIEASGWESEPPIIDDFELPEEPAFEARVAVDDEVPLYRPPTREIDPFAKPTLDLTPKARPKFVRPRSLPPALPESATTGPHPARDPITRPASPRSPRANASPEPVEGACPPPIFPKIAQLRGWSGTVYLWIDVSATGTVTGVRIDTSSGHSILDEAAIKAVKGWRFTPAVDGGAPAAVTVRKPIEFNLGGA